jgi:hypothetical protein
MTVPVVLLWRRCGHEEQIQWRNSIAAVERGGWRKNEMLGRRDEIILVF